MLKQAALKIAALAKPDRDWLLAELSELELRQLRPILAEVASFGLDGVCIDVDGVVPAVDAMEAVPPQAPTCESTSIYEEWLRLPPFWRDVLVPGGGRALTREQFDQAILDSGGRGAKLRDCVLGAALPKSGNER